MIDHIIKALIIGPLTSLKMFFAGPVSVFNIGCIKLYPISGFLVLFALLLFRPLNILQDAASDLKKTSVQNPEVRNFYENSISSTHTLKLLLLSLLLLAVSYGFSFTHYPPNETHGRLPLYTCPQLSEVHSYFPASAPWL